MASWNSFLPHVLWEIIFKHLIFEISISKDTDVKKVGSKTWGKMLNTYFLKYRHLGAYIPSEDVSSAEEKTI